jgi:hypothetical protein
MAVNESSVKSHFRERGQINWNDPILLYPKNLIACIKHLSNEMLRLCPTQRSTRLRQQALKIAFPRLTHHKITKGPDTHTIIEAPRGGSGGGELICSGQGRFRKPANRLRRAGDLVSRRMTRSQAASTRRTPPTETAGPSTSRLRRDRSPAPGARAMTKPVLSRPSSTATPGSPYA